MIPADFIIYDLQWIEINTQPPSQIAPSFQQQSGNCNQLTGAWGLHPHFPLMSITKILRLTYTQSPLHLTITSLRPLTASLLATPPNPPYFQPSALTTLRLPTFSTPRTLQLHVLHKVNTNRYLWICNIFIYMIYQCRCLKRLLWFTFRICTAAYRILPTKSCFSLSTKLHNKYFSEKNFRIFVRIMIINKNKCRNKNYVYSRIGGLVYSYRNLCWP